jgi:hypothetical protein
MFNQNCLRATVVGSTSKYGVLEVEFQGWIIGLQFVHSLCIVLEKFGRPMGKRSGSMTSNLDKDAFMTESVEGGCGLFGMIDSLRMLG